MALIWVQQDGEKRGTFVVSGTCLNLDTGIDFTVPSISKLSSLTRAAILDWMRAGKVKMTNASRLNKASLIDAIREKWGEINRMATTTDVGSDHDEPDQSSIVQAVQAISLLPVPSSSRSSGENPSFVPFQGQSYKIQVEPEISDINETQVSEHVEEDEVSDDDESVSSVDHFYMPSGSTDANDETDGDDQSDGSFGTREDLEFTIKLFTTGEDFKELRVWQHSKVGELLSLVLWEQKPFDVFYNGKKLHKTQRLSKFVPERGELRLVPRDMSGGGLIRKHLSKEVALTNFKKKAKQVVQRTLKIDELAPLDESVNESSHHQKFIEDMKKLCEDVRFMKSQGTNIIETALRRVGDADLALLKDVMAFKTGGRRSIEDNIIKAAFLMFPILTTLENSKVQVSLLQQEMLNEFVGVYIDEFNVYKDGGVNFNNSDFVKKVEKEEIRRQTLKGISQPTAEVSDGPHCVVS